MPLPRLPAELPANERPTGPFQFRPPEVGQPRTEVLSHENLTKMFPSEETRQPRTYAPPYTDEASVSGVELLLSKTNDEIEDQSKRRGDTHFAVQGGAGKRLKKKYGLRSSEASVEEVSDHLTDKALEAVRSAHTLSVRRGVVGRNVQIDNRRQVSDVGGGDGISAALEGVAGGSIGRVFGRNYKLNRLWRSKSYMKGL